MNEQEIINEFFEVRPEFAVQANGPTLLTQASRPLTVEALISAATQLESVLILAPAYQSAWDQHKFYNAEKSGIAFRRIFLEKMRKDELQAKYVHDYNSLVKELGEANRGLSISDLREIAATRRENTRRKSLSGEELRTLARRERPALQVDDLPTLYTPFGQTREVVLTADVLRAAGTRNADLSLRDLRFLCERYGSKKVNERLGVPSTTKQYKTLPPNVTKKQVIEALRSDAARIWVRDYGHD